MSRTYDLVCPETKKAIWVGQRDYLYADPAKLAALAKWLHEHKDKQIYFVGTESGLLDDIEHKNWIGMEDEDA